MIFLNLILLQTAAACDPGEGDLLRSAQFIMGTLVEITVREPDADKARRAVGQAFDEMRRLEKLMSSHLAESEISRLNEAAGAKISLAVSPEVLEVLQRGAYWGNLSNGAFDVSIGPASRLWRFEDQNPSLPEADSLAQATRLVNHRDVEISASRVRLKRPGMALRLGAIAKGYAVDKAMDVLKKSRIRHALINAGGDLKALGKRKDDQPWSIGLRHPRKPEKMIASFALSNKAVATSGDYQKYFMLGGARYHHILDPASGLPARGTISSTVIADSVMDADALATAVFVLGPEKGVEWMDSLSGVEGMVITETGSILFSRNFQSQPEFVARSF